MAAGRHLVQAGVADDYIAALSARADHLPVGDPTTGTVALGPVIDAGQRDRIHELVTASVDAGARLAAGGTYEDLFYRPTVLADVPTGPHRPTPRRSSGPSRRSLRFDSIDEVVRLAADTPYGLSLGILTRDVMRGLEIAERIPTGLVHINDQTINDEATIPFGGVKDSGHRRAARRRAGQPRGVHRHAVGDGARAACRSTRCKNPGGLAGPSRRQRRPPDGRPALCCAGVVLSRGQR